MDTSQEFLAEERARRRLHYDNNKQAYLSRAAKWREENREKHRASCRAAYHKRRERSRELHKVWQKENKGACNAKTRTYQADKLNRTPAWADLVAIKQIYIECARISRETGIKHHVDHIIPLRGKTVSGLHVPNNLQIITAEENIQKRNYTSSSLIPQKISTKILQFMLT